MKIKYLVYQNIKIEPHIEIKTEKFSDVDEALSLMRGNNIIFFILERHTLSIEEYSKINMYSIKESIQIMYFYIPLLSLDSKKREKRKELGLINIIEAENKTFEKKELLKAYDTIIFSGHGEGSHLNLNNLVLCACKDSNDIKERCRKSITKDVIYLEETDANNYVFLSCNSALFNNELYPNEKNLLFTILEQADYVIASLNPIILRSEYIELLKKGLQYGLSFPKLTHLLNRMYYFHYKLTPFICCSKSYFALETNTVFDDVPLNESTLSSEFMIISDDSLFRFSNSVIYFDKIITNFRLSPLADLLSEKDRLFQYIAFLEEFMSYLALKKALSDKEKDKIFFIIKTLKNKLFLLSLEIHSIVKNKITNFKQFEKIQKVLALIAKACYQQTILINENGYLYDYFENFVDQCFEEYEYLLSSKKCTRCHSNLNTCITKSLFNSIVFTKYSCPICGVHSIYFGNDIFFNHGYKYDKDSFINFFHGNKNFKLSYFRLYDKSKGEIWYERKGIHEQQLCIDTESLNPDVHSYKSFFLSQKGVVYIHGKFIKE